MRVGYGRSIFERLLPIILGRDVSGEVAAIGSEVKSVSVGQQVFGALHPTAIRGTYTDYAILSQDEVTAKPDSLSHVVWVLEMFLFYVYHLLLLLLLFSDYTKEMYM
jgi:NADPH:quinone reductase-like Zn-dependent oxidoreductase